VRSKSNVLNERLREVKTFLSEMSNVRTSKYLLDQYLNKRMSKGISKEKVVEEFNLNLKVYEAEKNLILKLLNSEKKVKNNSSQKHVTKYNSGM
jgi:hypothetical protein